MAPVSRPARRQRGAGIPAHTERQGQRVADSDFRVSHVAGDAVRGGGVDGAGAGLAVCGVQEQVQAVADVQVAKLQGAGQADDERGVQVRLRAEGAFLRGLVGYAVLLLENAGGEGLRWDAAGEGRVVVDVEFQQVEEAVGDEFDGAVYLALDAEEEFEGAPGFVARREGDVLELAVDVGDVLACLSVVVLAGRSVGRGIGIVLHCAVQAGDGNWLACVVASCFFEPLQRFLTAHRACKRCPEGTQRQQRQPGDLRGHCSTKLNVYYSVGMIKSKAHREPVNASLGALELVRSVNLHMHV